MKALLAASVVAIGLGLGAGLGPASADEADIAAAQGVIDGQMDAFRTGDDALAYSFASPTLKRIFPNQDVFMRMVETGYPPVHRPQNYAFGKVEQTSPDAIIQQVLILGPDGKDYEAVYTLERQPDGSFKITGVSMRASNALST